MRSYLLIFGTLALLGGAFFFYWHNQPAISAQMNPAIRPVAPPTTKPLATYGDIHEGSRPWAVMYDARGNISSRYKAQEYLPQKDGTVHLIEPQADFFLGEHQRLHVTGVDGDVVMRTAPKIALDAAGAAPSGPPSRGRLHTVTMTLIDDAAVGGPATVLTMNTDNIDFDNDTFLITTGGFTSADGTMIAADQVPVKVRGEYEFDGRGLTLRWNDVDDRLELLEIAHGEELRILHPSSRSGPGNAVKATPVAGGSPPATLPANPSPPVASADNVAPPTPARTDPSPPAATRASGASTKPAKQPKPTYVATFQEAVRITQGDESLITADTMRMHFRLKEQETAATTQPSGMAPAPGSESAKGQPVANPQEPAPAAPETPAAPQGGAGSASPPVPAAPPTAAVAPEEIPVVVHWTGKLRIVPELSAPPRPVGPGDAIMELISKTNPVRVYRAAIEDAPASEVQCARLLYMTADGSAYLSGSDAFGQVQIARHGVASISDEDTPPPTLVNADTVDYGGAKHPTVLGSNGHAIIPIVGAPGTKPGILDAKWTDHAEFEFFPRSGDEMAIRSARFFGNVEIRHPQIDLDSQALALLFESPAGSAPKSAAGAQSALSEMTAADRVHCRLSDTAGKQQTVDAAWLDLHTARGSDGKVFARQVDARGNASQQVHASDGTQELYCDLVRMMLRPARKAPQTQPEAEAAGGVDTSSVELERMDARGSVKVESKDGSEATSDQLLVAMGSDGPHVMFTGNSLSKVADAKKNVLSGPTIVMQPHQQLAHVIGPGTLHEVAEPATAGKAATRQLDVIWSDGADLDGTGNQIKLRGKVVATMPDSDGMIDTANAQTLRIDLMPKAVAATQSAAAAHATPSTKPAEDMDLLRNKQPKLITLDTPDGDSIVESSQSDARGVLRQSQLKAPRIIYAVAASDDLPAHSLLVPSGGVMLVRDHRPPAPAAHKEDDPSGLGTGRGATAFKWTRRLLYNEDTRKAVMSGDVMVVHQSDDAKDPLVQLNADEMTANFQPAAGKKSPAAQPGGQSPAMELKNMEAVGNVVVNRAPMQITSQRLYFEPATHWMTFDGSERNPVSVTDEKGTQTGDQVKWNTQTWDFAIKGGEGTGR